MSAPKKKRNDSEKIVLAEPVKMTFNLWIVEEVIDKRKHTFYFTDAPRPITYNAMQYIPFAEYDIIRKLNIKKTITK